jgi:hypothetical protein
VSKIFFDAGKGSFFETKHRKVDCIQPMPQNLIHVLFKKQRININGMEKWKGWKNRKLI